MSNENWRVKAVLEEGEGALRLSLVASRDVGGTTETTADVMMVDHPAEARLECTRLAQMLGVNTYTLDDRRRGAA